MTRKPRPWRPAGTEPPALFGSRDAPTTAIVFAFCRTSCELRATVIPSYPMDRLFRTSGVKPAIGERKSRTSGVRRAGSGYDAESGLGRFGFRLRRRRGL